MTLMLAVMCANRVWGKTQDNELDVTIAFAIRENGTTISLRRIGGHRG